MAEVFIISSRHFKASKAKNPRRPSCPFGKDCFYQHLNDDGSPFTFKDGAEGSMRVRKLRASLMLTYPLIPSSFPLPQALRNSRRRFDPFSFEMIARGGMGAEGDLPFHVEFAVPTTGSGPEAEMDAVSLAGNIAMDMFDRMVAEVMSANGTMGERGRGRGRGRGRAGERGRGGRRGNGGDPTLDRARHRMMAGAVSAIRAELNRLDGPRNGGNGGSTGGGRPVVVPGTLAPQDWDLDGDGDVDGEGIDNGWGWNEFLSDAGADGDADVMESLELLVSSYICIYQLEWLLMNIRRITCWGHSEFLGEGTRKPLHRYLNL